MANSQDEVLQLHATHHGVLSIQRELPVTNKTELGQAYTPGVAVISKMIEKYPEMKNRYTMSGKLVAVITDGSAVLGLGNIGPAGGLPVVEGKSLLYKDLAGVDAIPMAVDQVPVDEVVTTIKNISKTFAGIHLDDIAAPRCFEIEEKLSNVLDIPVYHDDQEGTAIVVLAGLINAAKVVGKKLTDLKIVINGAGASGIATARLLQAVGIKELTLVDIHGVVTADDQRYNRFQCQLAAQLPAHDQGATLSDVIKNQDVFIGLSDANVLSATQVKSMAVKPIVFALANPKPEIDPAVAQQAGVAIMATGSSQYPNQVNNILAFPGLYKGLLATHLKRVTYDLEAALARGIASLVKQPRPDKIVPGVFDDGVVATVSQAVVDFEKER